MVRGLDGFMILVIPAVALCSFEGPGEAGLSSFSGGFGERETPLPIPNRAVKPLSADGTWPARARESRTPPVFSTRAACGRPVVVVAPLGSCARSAAAVIRGKPGAASRALTLGRARDRRPPTLRGLPLIHDGVSVEAREPARVDPRRVAARAPARGRDSAAPPPGAIRGVEQTRRRGADSEGSAAPHDARAGARGRTRRARDREGVAKDSALARHRSPADSFWPARRRLPTSPRSRPPASGRRRPAPARRAPSRLSSVEWKKPARCAACSRWLARLWLHHVDRTYVRNLGRPSDGIDTNTCTRIAVRLKTASTSQISAAMLQRELQRRTSPRRRPVRSATPVGAAAPSPLPRERYLLRRGRDPRSARELVLPDGCYACQAL
jgi:hypothetical protein